MYYWLKNRYNAYCSLDVVLIFWGLVLFFATVIVSGTASASATASVSEAVSAPATALVSETVSASSEASVSVIPSFFQTASVSATASASEKSSASLSSPATSFSELVPAALIKGPSNGSSAIIVEKDTQTLRVYTFFSSDDKYRKVFESPCSTGEAYGRKKIEGDKKTPEGVYFIKDVFEDRYLSPIYGKRAFTTDYPNLMDIMFGRTGSAIWIHGTNKILKAMDSNGCVAMNNDDVVNLDKFIETDMTPVIITGTIEYAYLHTVETERDSLFKFLVQWLKVLNSGTLNDFKLYYGLDREPDIGWWEEWERNRKNPLLQGDVSLSSEIPVNKNAFGQATAALGDVHGDKSSFFVDASNVGIYRQNEQLVILFDLLARSTINPRDFVFVGKRKFFLQPNKGMDKKDIYRSIAFETNFNNSTTPAMDKDLDGELNVQFVKKQFPGSGEQILYRIVGDEFQFVSVKCKPGQYPLTAAASFFRNR
ncbi:L,D-transpeptidase family protein [Desulfamplus magnetovallimortis]|nr:L,D-transpeptidase family protein [Desulfamplus magnetovallimortis]